MSYAYASRTQPRVYAALCADTSPLGMTHEEVVAATGFQSSPVTSALRGLRKAGKCFVLGAYKDSRYFASAERMEACRPAWDAFMAQLQIQRLDHKRERERLQERAYYARLKAAGRLRKRERKPRPPKPPKAATPKKPKAAKSVNAGGLIVRQPALSANVQIKKPREVLPVVVPAHVRVQVCPCGKDQRYSVPADHVGEWTREWQEKRA